MIDLDFLIADIPTALKHHSCCVACLDSAQSALKNGNLELAEKRMMDFERSLKELHRLKEKKQRQDQLKEVVKQLVNNGVLAETISMEKG